MKALRLTRTVEVCGRNFFGRTSLLTFHPISMDGWWLSSRIGGALSPITASIALSRRRRSVLHHPKTGESLNVYEHILPLVFTGLTGVAITSSSAWPPYHGRTLELWQTLRPHCKETGELFWQSRPVAAISTATDSLVRSASIHPAESKLVVEAEVMYPSLGALGDRYEFPNLPLLERLFAARIQGWPRGLRRLASVASSFGWPHFDKIVWPQDGSREEVLREFLDHRVLDCLGVIGTLVPAGGMLAATIRTSCGGHALETALVHLAQSYQPEIKAALV